MTTIVPSKAYYKDYYAKNRKKYAEYSKKYRNSEKGKATCKRNQEKWQKSHPTYAKDYQHNIRMKAKEQGFCIYCFKNKKEGEFSTCSSCREKIRISTKLRNNA